MIKDLVKEKEEDDEDDGVVVAVNMLFHIGLIIKVFVH
jgi:hypothetical protein